MVSVGDRITWLVLTRNPNLEVIGGWRSDNIIKDASGEPQLERNRQMGIFNNLFIYFECLILLLRCVC